MLIRKTDYLTVDVDYNLWEELPNKDGRRRFPFQLSFTVQINGKIKKTNTQFEVYHYENEKVPTYEKLDLVVVHSVIDLLRDLWYEIDYPEVTSSLWKFVDYKMQEINKYLTNKAE